MWDSVRNDPPEWLTAIVRLLVPPEAREHVLGDLQERLQRAGRGNATRQYLSDAISTVPLVIWSQMRRAVPLRLLYTQALLLYTLFAAGAFFLPGKQGLVFLIDQHGFLRVVVPAMLTLAVLVVGDTYVSPKPRPWHQVRLVALAIGIACLSNVVLAYSAKNWAVPGLVMFPGALFSFMFVLPVRGCLFPAPVRRKQAAAQIPLSLEAVRYKAQAFEKEIRRRTFGGYVAAALVGFSFAWFGFISLNAVQRTGAFATVAGGLYMAWQLYRRTAAAMPARATDEDLVPFYRAELARQRDFHQGSWFWSRLVLFAPGPLVFLAGAGLAHPDLWGAWCAEGAVFLVLGALAVPLNLRVARRYQRRMDELDAIEKQP